MTRVIPTDIHDKDGNLLQIHFEDAVTGEFCLQSEWDSREEQTAENRKKFREWSVLMAKRLGFDVFQGH